MGERDQGSTITQILAADCLPSYISFKILGPRCSLYHRDIVVLFQASKPEALFINCSVPRKQTGNWTEIQVIFPSSAVSASIEGFFNETILLGKYRTLPVMIKVQPRKHFLQAGWNSSENQEDVFTITWLLQYSVLCHSLIVHVKVPVIRIC